MLVSLGCISLNSDCPCQHFSNFMLSRTFFRHSEPDSETVKMNNRDGEWRGFRIFFEIGIEAKSDSTLDEFLCHGDQ